MRPQFVGLTAQPQQLALDGETAARRLQIDDAVRRPAVEGAQLHDRGLHPAHRRRAAPACCSR
jgi:hypothetical protein